MSEMRTRSARWVWRRGRAWAALAVIAGVLWACTGGGGGGGGTPLPAITLRVDPTVVPRQASLPGFTDGEPRPLAAITGDDGAQADFVADEVWWVGDDDTALAAFLARWNGTVLATLDPVEAGLPGVARQVLVRIDPGLADPSRLPADLRALESKATGDHRVSSAEGLGLLAATSREAAAGRTVGINWVGVGATFLDRTTVEAATGSGSAGAPYQSNAFLWPAFSRGSPQDIGVAEAWRALELAGRLDERVGLAILDMGFAPDADMPTPWIALSNVPLVLNPINRENILACGSGPCPWHGQSVAGAAMARPDNGFGAAGPAGPIARPVLVFTMYDFFTSITALAEARFAGAKIANMSYGAGVPWYVAWSVVPFEIATLAFRTTGMLLFAAAGNDGQNVDSEGCTLGICWERTWHTPCENAGVICVGGLAANSTFRAGGSNYGPDQVDIFGPFTLWVGPDPATPGNAARVVQGTSVASPFVAGVAALIWAANPGLGASDVESLLLSTAHLSGDGTVGRYVNALGAVTAALGNVPPSITIGAGGEVPFNLTTYLSATVQDVEDPFPCCTVTWSSDVDGPLGTGWQIEHRFATMGSRVVTATAVDSGGASNQASATYHVVNVAPAVTLSNPLNGAQVFRTAVVQLRARASDRNEFAETLPCSGLTWTSSVPGDPFPIVGCEVQAVFASNGPRVLTVTATDAMGASDAASVSITVVDPPANLPPNVQVTSPQTNTAPPVNQPLTLSGIATDPEGAAPLTYVWTTKLGAQAPIVVGNAATVQWTPNQTYAFNQEGTWTVVVRLEVTDPGGAVGTDFVVLEWVFIF